MKAHLIVLAGSLAAFLGWAADDAALAERKKLVGVWKGHAVEGTGEKPGGPVKLTVTITMEKISAVQDENKDLGAGSYKLDPDAKPKRLDGTYVRGQVPKGFYQGIYQLEGNTLKWCTALPRIKDPPKEFRTEKGIYLMVLQREPAAK